MSKIGLFYNKPMNEYHKLDGFLSSSQLKLVLNDPVMFHQKYILKTIKSEQKDHFDVGNAFHTKVLEPEKYDEEFIAYNGHRRGDKWKEFAAKHEGKIILGNKSALEVDNLVKGVTDSKPAMSLLTDAKYEASVYVKLNGFPVKVRFDSLQAELQRAADPKSCTGQLTGQKGTYICQKIIAGLDYDLSAALYLDAYNELIRLLNKKIGKSDKPYPFLKEWYWIFASKDFVGCRTFRATPLMLKNGRVKYQLAIEKYNEYTANNWKMEIFEDRIEDIDPLNSDIIIPDHITEAKEW